MKSGDAAKVVTSHLESALASALSSMTGKEFSVEVNSSAEAVSDLGVILPSL